jgi:TPR repeat protein
MAANEEIEMRAHKAWAAGNLELAFKLFSIGAVQGLDGCMLDLGYFFDEGIGIPIDKQQAMHWYKKAYRRGSSAAASNIAILYREKGRLNYTAQWFQRAARLNDGDAEVELAKLYMAGIGVRKSITAAKTHLTKALATSYITQAGREEAEELMAKLQMASNNSFKADSQPLRGRERP